jgi:hypothetical protein
MKTISFISFFFVFNAYAQPDFPEVIDSILFHHHTHKKRIILTNTIGEQTQYLLNEKRECIQKYAKVLTDPEFFLEEPEERPPLTYFADTSFYYNDSIVFKRYKNGSLHSLTTTSLIRTKKCASGECIHELKRTVNNDETTFRMKSMNDTIRSYTIIYQSKVQKDSLSNTKRIRSFDVTIKRNKVLVIESSGERNWLITFRGNKAKIYYYRRPQSFSSIPHKNFRELAHYIRKYAPVNNTDGDGNYCVIYRNK